MGHKSTLHFSFEVRAREVRKSSNVQQNLYFLYLLFLNFLVTHCRNLESLDQRRLYFATFCLVEVDDLLSNESDIWVIVRFNQVAANNLEEYVLSPVIPNFSYTFL